MVERNKRTLSLIASFEGGYAKNWYFAVSEAFKDQLDIKHTKRMVPCLNKNGEPIMVQKTDKKGNAKFRKNGMPMMQKKTKSTYSWTQGNIFCFERGCVFYDSPDGYLVWKDALKKINFICQIVSGTPDAISELKEHLNGKVQFELFRPNKEKNRIEKQSSHNVSQREFVQFLKDGVLNGVLVDQSHGFQGG